MDKLVITRLQGKICTASVSDRKVTGITLEEEDKASILNNIYIGKVQKVVTGINAAFVDLGVTIGYYSLDENKEHLFTQQGRNGKLRPGDEILVQVSRDAVKTKAPVLTVPAWALLRSYSWKNRHWFFCKTHRYNLEKPDPENTAGKRV